MPVYNPRQGSGSGSGSPGVSGGTLTIRDEGVLVSTGVSELNFIGNEVIATNAGGGSVNVTINVDDPITRTEVATISAGLDGRLQVLEAIDHDSFALYSELVSVSGNLQSQIDAISGGSGFTPLAGTGITITPSGPDYTFSVTDYISSTEVANVTGNLQVQITDLSDDFVLKTGDTMTGDLVMDSSSIQVTGGEIQINGSRLAKTETGGVVTNTIIDSVPVADGNCVFWDLLVTDGTNYRASRLMVVWNDAADTIKINETSTESIGDTDGVDMNVMFNVGNTEVQLKATIMSGTWTIQAFKKVL